MAGFARLAAVCVLLALTALAVVSFDEAFEAAIRWVDHLFPKPGLGGVAMVAVMPVVFMLGALIVRWVIRGFMPPHPSGNDSAQDG